MSARTVVIGAGASGLMAAGTAASRGSDTVVAERNARPARKVMITGKGRCNLTNDLADLNAITANIPHGGKFLIPALSRFMPADTKKFFEDLGVELVTERGNRVFPASQKAVDIVDALDRFARRNGAKTVRGRCVAFEFGADGSVTAAVLETGERIEGDSFIICTGGLSYPATGSTGDGYALAVSAGHTIVPTRPSLVPLVTDDEAYFPLEGVSLKNVRLTLTDGHSKKPVFSEQGEMLFTARGISGPIVLSASAHFGKFPPSCYTAHIDLKPALDRDTLDRRIVRDIEKYAGRSVSNALRDLLIRALIPVVLDKAGINGDINTGEFTREQRAALVSAVKDLPVRISALGPYTEAVVTSGGVSLKEIDPRTMRSKLCPNLYFAGEVIDADAYTGGFNLQIAFSTGRLAGMSVPAE